jgi:hypothetical protein
VIFVIIIVLGAIAIIALYLGYKGKQIILQSPIITIPQDDPAQQPPEQQPPDQQPTDKQPTEQQPPDQEEPQEPAGCFLAGTLVRTETGLVAIEEVKLGARVISYSRDNPTKRAALEVKGRISQLENEILVLSFAAGEIACTSRQSFYADGRWVAAPQLAQGHKLQTHSGAVREVLGITRKRGDFTVFHLFFSQSGHGYAVGCSNGSTNPIQVRELDDDPVISTK